MSLGDELRDAASDPPPTRLDLDGLIHRESRRARLRRWLGILTAAAATVGTLALLPTLLTSPAFQTASAGDGTDHSDALTSTLNNWVRDRGLDLSNLSWEGYLGSPPGDFPYGFNRKDNFYGYMGQLNDSAGHAALVVHFDVKAPFEAPECTVDGGTAGRAGWLLRTDHAEAGPGELSRTLTAVRSGGPCVRLTLANSLAMNGRHDVARAGLPLSDTQLADLAYALADTR